LTTSAIFNVLTLNSYDRMEGLSVVESADWGGHPMSYIKASDGSGFTAEVEPLRFTRPTSIRLTIQIVMKILNKRLPPHLHEE